MPPELETSFTVTPEHPDRPVDEIRAVSDLLMQETAPEQSEQTAELEEPEQEQETATLEAEESEDPEGLEPEQEEPEQQQGIDYDLEVPMPDGMESMTIGQLKDLARDNHDLQTERADWEALQSQQRQELALTRQELVTIAGALGEVKPEVVQALRQQQAQRANQSRELLLQTFPEWNDPEKKAAARTIQLDTAKHYGLSEIEYSGITDHRMIHALQDLAMYRKRDAEGRAKREQLAADLPKGQKAKKRPNTSAQQRAALIERAKSGDENAKTAAITAIINGA